MFLKIEDLSAKVQLAIACHPTGANDDHIHRRISASPVLNVSKWFETEIALCEWSSSKLLLALEMRLIKLFWYIRISWISVANSRQCYKVELLSVLNCKSSSSIWRYANPHIAMEAHFTWDIVFVKSQHRCTLFDLTTVPLAQPSHMCVINMISNRGKNYSHVKG